MKKLIAVSLVLASLSAPAQTLFYYGKDSVPVKEFLRAYQKNNTGVKTEKAFLEYLDLFINSRLKIAEAKQRGYDTLPQLVADLETLRQQILPTYLTDKQTINRMVDEAFTRSQKDIKLAHIFIASKATDTLETVKKVNDVITDLKKDQLNKTSSFSELAKKYSDDPSAKTNGGDIGYITVFTLPYELENLAYSTPPGKVSAIHRSKAGYHIFKNLGERKAAGQMKAAEILLAFPPDADPVTKAGVKKLADSLYNRLLKGDDFGKLATQFSNDMISAAANGVIPEFTTGQYDAIFENTVFALPNDGAISKPFLTSHGYHIVKRISKTPITATRNAKSLEAIREKVEQSDRMNTTKSLLAKKILREASYKKAPFDNAELWAYSDSVLNNQAPRTAVHLTKASPLFSFGNQTVTVDDWVNYSQTFRYKSDGSGIKPYAQVWDDFVEARALDYYQSHLEDYNEEFRQQINEFKDGNLFFEIMQRQVWERAQTDSVALVEYYKKNKSNYNWKESADAVIFYANDAATAKSFTENLKKFPKNWREVVSRMSEKVAADSSRFELSQIPNATNTKEGAITPPLTNKSDNTVSFAYIIKYHPRAEPRNFTEARGLVITDYQNELEKSWLAELKKKYPVQFDQQALDELKRKKQY